MGTCVDDSGLAEGRPGVAVYRVAPLKALEGAVRAHGARVAVGTGNIANKMGVERLGVAICHIDALDRLAIFPT